MLLTGMRVVSFCHYLQGPAATQYLADQGAEVVKVEPPGGAFERHWCGADAYVNGLSAFYLCANRNKRSLAVDLKSEEGREAVMRLIERSDVVVENFRPGVLDRLGLGYAEVAARRPEIVYASATAFGPDGPLRDRPGQDLLAQARTGLAAVTGGRGQAPTAVGCAAVDQHGAALLALGILAAYIRRLTQGRGTRVEASLFNAGIDLQTEPLTLFFAKGADRSLLDRAPGLATWFHAGPYGTYRVRDGFLALSMNELGRLARALDSAALAELAGCDAYAERDRVAAVVAEVVAERDFAALAAAFDAHGIWYERVQDYTDLAADPQAIHNGVFREIRVGGSLATVVNHPLRYDGEVPAFQGVAAAPGTDTRAILAELGYAEAEIDRLAAAGIVATS